MIPRREIAPGRRRVWLLCSGAIVIAVGLLVHSVTSGPIGDFAADALYAVLIYLLVAVVFPRRPTFALFGVALALCVGIELFQLTGVPSALAAVFPPARLVLGTTFVPVDLLAYAVGALVAGLADAAARSTRKARVA